jgi:hypothetical protein
LDDLARRSGVDTRPTLARVLTDLYVQKPAHTLDEEVHYTELVLRLLDAVDVPTRAVVASKLAHYPVAPRAVVVRLARDVIEVAEPVLRHSPCLPGPEQIAIVAECGPLYAAALAARGDRATAPGDRALPSRPSATSLLPRSSSWRRAIAGLEPTALAAADAGLGELFLAASSEERRAILTDLDTDDVPPRQPVANDAIQRLEMAALARKPEDFIRELEHAFGVSAQIARRITEDGTGEPLLVAAKALDMSSEVLIRILLFLNPAIGESVPRVFGLAQLYLELAPSAALQIVTSLRDSAPTRAIHQPALWNDDADSGRRAGMDAARRGLAPAGQPQFARREGSVPARRHGTT